MQRGGSLDLWQDYFGAGGRFVGLDINPACAALANDRRRISIGDQADLSLLQRIVAECGLFDIVLDDGGPTVNQMITTFETLYATTNCPGACLAEDTHTCF